MFDLNEKKFGGTVIFNNGQGGKIDNVDISVVKKTMEEPDTYPQYKLVVEDASGGKINQGYYYPVADPQKTDEQNEQRAVREVGRVISIAKAVLGRDYIFPKVASAKEAFDVLFPLISKEAGGKKFNVFATYGTSGYPGKFLGLRYFDFIEAADAPLGRLVKKPTDLLERVEQDAPKSAATDMLSGGSAAKKQEWV